MSIEIARLLLEHGAKIRNPGAVHQVAGRGQIDILEASLEYGAELDECIGCDSETPFTAWSGAGVCGSTVAVSLRVVMLGVRVRGRRLPS